MSKEFFANCDLKLNNISIHGEFSYLSDRPKNYKRFYSCLSYLSSVSYINSQGFISNKHISKSIINTSSQFSEEKLIERFGFSTAMNEDERIFWQQINDKRYENLSFLANEATSLYEFYEKDIVVTRINYKQKKKKNFVCPVRSKIAKFTKGSMKRLKFKLRNTSANLNYMITLTYPQELIGIDGSVSKKHLNHFLTRLRQFGVKDYTWVLEFQKNTNPHYHLCLNREQLFNSYKFMLSAMKNVSLNDLEILKINDMALAFISKIWYQVVGSGLEKHFKAGTRCEKIKHSVSSYLRKYISKYEQKIVPPNYENVGRLWGFARCSSPVRHDWRYISGKLSYTLKVLYLEKLFEDLEINKPFEDFLNGFPSSFILWNYHKLELDKIFA